MRRRPIAVYRVIDEQELLGGDDVEGSYRAADRPADQSPVPGPAVARPPWRRGAAHRMGWASAASAVAALVCVALLLLNLPPPAREPVQAPPASHPAAAEPRADRVWRVAATASPAHAQARSTQRARAHRRRPKARLRGGSTGHPPPPGARSARVALSPRASDVPAAQAPGRSVAVQAASGQEFGFER
jgi:hypothetical protein